jgi:Uma2 family endonuclease
LAENTRQLRWIVILFGNLAALFRDHPDVFVAADLFWYPVEGEPEIRQAPDVLLVFGRPKGHRGSYLQWQEGNVPLTVVFEILSPSNTWEEMEDKGAFYEEHGVEEYYVYNPDTNRLRIFVRRGEMLRRVHAVQGFISPRLGVRFDFSGPEMVVYRPDGRPFLTFEEMEVARVQAEQERDQLRQERDRLAQQTARLAELSRKARHGQATPEELQELDRLEGESAAP